MSRGYFEVGICNGKSAANVGTLWRSAFQLGAAGIFTIGKRYPRQASDTVKASGHGPSKNVSGFLGSDHDQIPAVAPAVAAEPAAGERAAFEAWWEREGRERYFLPKDQSWQAWQAARAAAPVPAGVVEKVRDTLTSLKLWLDHKPGSAMTASNARSLIREALALLAPQRADQQEKK